MMLNSSIFMTCMISRGEMVCLTGHKELIYIYIYIYKLFINKLFTLKFSYKVTCQHVNDKMCIDKF